jgi:hypothetical protein
MLRVGPGVRTSRLVRRKRIDGRPRIDAAAGVGDTYAFVFHTGDRMNNRDELKQQWLKLQARIAEMRGYL